MSLNDEDRDIRQAAVNRLTDQSILAKVAMEDERMEIRVAATSRIETKSLLRWFARDNPHAVIRRAAITRLKDDGFLLICLDDEPSRAVRDTIVGAMQKTTFLSLIAVKGYHKTVRTLAADRLTEELGNLPPKVRRGQQKLVRRVTQLRNETDPSKLMEQALQGDVDVVRIEAARRLVDPASLELVAMRSDRNEVLSVVLPKVTDPASLNRISQGAESRAMRLAAARQAGLKSWQEIFRKATHRDAPVQKLGDAIAAVSLFKSMQSDASSGVQNGCLNLIRLGDESRVPEMVRLLDGYGDKRLAEDYLNCGQPDLGRAGRVWAREQGYTVRSGDGSSRAQWGSARR